MDKKQIEFLRKIYNHPMDVKKLRRKCGIDIDTYHREYCTLDMAYCFDVINRSANSDYEGLARITPKGREAVEIYDRDFRHEIRAEKAITQASVSIAVSIFAGIVSIVSLIFK